MMNLMVLLHMRQLTINIYDKLGNWIIKFEFKTEFSDTYSIRTELEQSNYYEENEEYLNEILRYSFDLTQIKDYSKISEYYDYNGIKINEYFFKDSVPIKITIREIRNSETKRLEIDELKANLKNIRLEDE